MKRRIRVAAVVSHAIQYQAPLFREVTNRPEVDLTVYFCSEWGTSRHFDRDFGTAFNWDSSLLAGYESAFVSSRFSKNIQPRRSTDLICPALVKKLNQGKFDAVWVHGWGFLSHWLVFATACAIHVPILLRAETNALLEPNGPKLLIKRSILGALFRRVSAFLAIGKLNAAYYRSYGINSSRIFEAPYSVDNEAFYGTSVSSSEVSSETRRSYGIDGSRPVILFCGKLIERKGPQDLVEACSLVSRQVPVSLVFVGDGAELNALKALSSVRGLDHVHFLGFKNQSELPTLYAMADIFVLPSYAETWGLVVNEAMACGLPVIASKNVGCVPDLIDEGVTGYSFGAGNVAELSMRILSCLRDPEKTSEMGVSARRRVDEYSISRTADGIVSAALTVARP